MTDSVVKMTKDEKAEFDRLKETYGSVLLALDSMSIAHYPELTGRLVYNNTTEKDNEAVLEFARAWIDPSLIRIIPKEKYYNVKVPGTKDMYYYKDDDELSCDILDDDLYPGQRFTKEELVHYNFDLPLFEKEEIK